MKELIRKITFKKFRKIVLSLAVLAVLVVVGYIGFGMYEKDIPIEKKEGTITEKITEDGGKIIEVNEVMKKPIVEEFPMTMLDYQVANAIHAMSHQKIVADKKWSFLPLTADRVTRLIDVIETNKSEYTNWRLYLKILTRWSENDFSQIDEEHNEIWELQGGNVGRATGILSYEEELEFIKKYYE